MPFFATFFGSRIVKITKTILALGASALLVSSMAAIAQEEDESYILEMTEVGIKLGHEAKFRDAVKPFNACIVENDADADWSAWRNVGGDGTTYWFVSTMTGWAEMDSPDQAGMKCWPEHVDNIMPHVSSISTSFARPMPDWSGDAEGYNVVRLHQFRVDDGSAFREAVGAITSILKEAEHEHLGSWYDMIGNSSNEPDYFVVSHYDNFAAMDEDRAGPYSVVREHAGEERADELWEQFGDALHDDWEYFHVMLRRDTELSHSSSDD